MFCKVSQVDLTLCNFLSYFLIVLYFIVQDADPEFSIVQFWARIEAIYCRNMEKARELWNIILTDEKSKTAEMWLEYIHLER